MSETSCPLCYNTFASHNQMKRHWKTASNHPYCATCNLLFSDYFALSWHHLVSPKHNVMNTGLSEPPCCLTCRISFGDVYTLYMHLAGPMHNICFVCFKAFGTPQAREQHWASKAHLPRDLLCPLCNKAFGLPSAIVQHIESGACRSNIDRHAVTRAVQFAAPAISLNHHIESGSNQHTSSRLIQYYTGPETFNGSRHECLICHASFRSPGSLNQHLNSPAHDRDQFKCPKCDTHFKLASGFVQHVESESCGFAKYEQVEAQMTALTARFSRLLHC